MNNFPGIGGDAFAPEPEDSLRDLLGKAEEMLEYLQENEAWLGKFPAGAVAERRALWRPLAALLRQALGAPALEEDARLEAQRVWAEEVHHSALWIVTMCVHARSAAARQRFQDDPEQLAELIAKFDNARPAAMSILPRDELDDLRTRGFLRAGE